MAPLVDAATVGRALGIASRTVLNLAARGEIPSLRIGSSARPIIRFDLDKILNGEALADGQADKSTTARRKPMPRPNKIYRV